MNYYEEENFWITKCNNKLCGKKLYIYKRIIIKDNAIIFQLSLGMLRLDALMKR